MRARRSPSTPPTFRSNRRPTPPSPPTRNTPKHGHLPPLRLLERPSRTRLARQFERDFRAPRGSISAGFERSSPAPPIPRSHGRPRRSAASRSANASQSFLTYSL